MAKAESLAALDQAKTAFVANVSHEFRTPLTQLLGPLERALAESDIDPSVRTEPDTAHRNAQRLPRLTNALLDLSQMGKWTPKRHVRARGSTEFDR